MIPMPEIRQMENLLLQGLALIFAHRRVLTLIAQETMTDLDRAELQSLRLRIEREMNEVGEPVLVSYIDSLRGKPIDTIQGGAVF